MFTVLFLAVVAELAPISTTLPKQVPSLSSKINDPQVIRSAITSALAENPGGKASENLSNFSVLNSKKYEQFSLTMNDARVPDCLHQDGLKRQPTFFLSGILALPFIAVAKLRGKCN